MLFVKQPPFPDPFVRLDRSAGPLVSVLSQFLAGAVRVDHPVFVLCMAAAKDDSNVDVPASFEVTMAGQLLGLGHSLMQRQVADLVDSGDSSSAEIFVSDAVRDAVEIEIVLWETHGLEGTSS